MWQCFFKIPSSFPLPPHPALPITSLLSQLNAICSSLALLLSSFSDTLTWPCALGSIFSSFKVCFFPLRTHAYWPQRSFDIIEAKWPLNEVLLEYYLQLN